MKVSFGSSELRELCCKTEIAIYEYDEYVAMMLQTLIAEAEAAENADQWHDILGAGISIGKDYFEISFGNGYIAHFVTAVQNCQLKGDGSVDWSSVSRLKLTDIMRR